LVTPNQPCSHEAAKLSPSLWASLLYIGVQRFDAYIDQDGRIVPAEAYELRNCTCGSTLALLVDEPSNAPVHEMPAFCGADLDDWDDETAAGNCDTPPCPTPLTDDVRGREGFEPAVQP
jgi:hypothetical protein